MVEVEEDEAMKIVVHVSTCEKQTMIRVNILILIFLLYIFSKPCQLHSLLLQCMMYSSLPNLSSPQLVQDIWQPFHDIHITIAKDFQS